MDLTILWVLEFLEVFVELIFLLLHLLSYGGASLEDFDKVTWLGLVSSLFIVVQQILRDVL